MLNLRTLEGLDYYVVSSKKNEIDKYIKSGYLVLKDNKIIPTFDGMMILDRIILDLFD